MGGRVSLNVLNYNTFEKTKVCIDSCLRQKGLDYDVILIDNHSSDGSCEKLRDFYGNKIKYICNKENYGYAKGNNIGVNYCHEQGYKYSFILNSDTELVGEELVSKLVNIIEEHKDCAVIVPTIYDVTREGLDQHINDSSYLKMLRYVGVLPKNKVLSMELVTLSEAHGSALLVNNEDFILTGGFPEHYFMYGEESTFSKKVLWNNLQIIGYNSKDQYILHHHDKSGHVEAWRLYLMGRNRGLEYWENKSKYPLWKIVYLIFLLRLRINSIISKEKSYLEGLNAAKLLHYGKASYDDCYKHAIDIREGYGK